MPNPPIRLAVFDLAGTLVDHGSLGPVRAFEMTLAQHGLELSAEAIRAPMGLGKREHLASLLVLPEARSQWQGAHGREPGPADLEDLYTTFTARQMAAIASHCEPLDGVVELGRELAEQGIAVATTTGYFRAAAEPVWAALAAAGWPSVIDLCPDDVLAGRPAPWMIFRAMEASGVWPPSGVVKVGDTELDIAEGLNAGAHSLAVVATGSLIGLSAAEWAALDEDAQDAELARAGGRLRAHGAHGLLHTALDLVTWLDDYGSRW